MRAAPRGFATDVVTDSLAAPAFRVADFALRTAACRVLARSASSVKRLDIRSISETVVRDSATVNGVHLVQRDVVFQGQSCRSTPLA